MGYIDEYVMLGLLVGISVEVFGETKQKIDLRTWSLMWSLMGGVLASFILSLVIMATHEISDRPQLLVFAFFGTLSSIASATLVNRFFPLKTVN